MESETGDGRVSVEWLRRTLTSALPERSWIAAFDEMLEYARSKGWLHDDETIAAHVEPSTWSTAMIGEGGGQW